MIELVPFSYVPSPETNSNVGVERVMPANSALPRLSEEGAFSRMSPGHSLPPPALDISAAKLQVKANRSMPQTEGAGQPVIPIDTLPSPKNSAAPSSLPTVTSMPQNPIVGELVELQKQRRFCIKSQSRCDRSAEAFMARMLGYRTDMPEAESKAIWKKVAAARKVIEKGGLPAADDLHESAPDGEGHIVDADHGELALSVCAPIVLLSAQSRDSWDKHRTQVEKRMRKLAESLPAYEWVKGIKGFGSLGLGIIIGETGDLSNYATKERVWKRLGLAVIDGFRQSRRTNVEEALAHGYNPARRAEVWTLLSDSLFRHSVAADKDEDGNDPKKSGKPVAVPAHPTGIYGEVYWRRKAHTESREGWTLGHRHNDARRIMSKFLLENLWRVWNGKNPLAVSGHDRSSVVITGEDEHG